MPTWLIPAPTGPTSGAELANFFVGLTNWFFAAFIVTAIFFVMFAGWQFVTRGGNPQSVASARNKLIWAAVAIIVAILSRGFIAAIGAILGG